MAGVGAALIALCSLAANLQLFNNWLEFGFGFVGSDNITKFDERYRDVKAVLPGQGVAGFITDNPGMVEEYYLTQYSLAPLLLEPGKTHEYVVSLYHNAPDKERPTGPEPYTVADLGYGTSLFDFGNGIKVYRTEQK
jgi:hypothetical protein